MNIARVLLQANIVKTKRFSGTIMFGVKIWAKLDCGTSGDSVPTEGSAQCLPSAFPKSIQSVGLDPAALSADSPTELLHEEKVHPAARNVAKQSVVCKLPERAWEATFEGPDGDKHDE